MNTPTTNDGWHGGDAYDRYMGRWSRQLAPRFLDRIDVPAGRRWLDVGCGTGALSSAILEHRAPAAVTGVDPSEGFLATARARLGDRVVFHRADAARLPLDDAAVDVAASSLVLNFVPDAVAALREMARVTVDDGRIAACVWDYAERMDLIRVYWDAAAEIAPLPPGSHQGERFPLCRPEALEASFGDAGLDGVDVSPIELEMRFAGFDDYWQPFLGGQGPAPAHAMSLPEALRDRVRERIRERLPARPDGTIVLAARAWAATGRVAR